MRLQLVWARTVARYGTGRPRLALAAAGVLLVALCLGAVLLLRGGGDGNSRVDAATRVAALSDLPARPDEIEARGAKARSVLPPADARARNTAVAFWPGPLDAARPFAFQGSEVDRARALDCLATAVLYEAGDDTVGEAAVAQVVLNRVRHPAFPATVCGVVYQGAERATGCQFTFTCDGSLRRQMPDAAWRRAREVARRALAGGVDRTVGLATHYHTDWVYPYWSPELRKLARVGSHLFFGWPGSWGAAGAFRHEYRGNEGRIGPPIADSTGVSEPSSGEPGPPRILGLPQPPAQLPAGMGNVPLYGNRVRLVHPDGRAFGLLAPPGAAASSLVNAALALCREPGFCEVSAWANEDDVPGEFPIPAGARGTMVFEYRRSDAAGKGSVRFDCARFPGKNPQACLPDRQDAPEILSGLRWKTG